MVEGNIVFIEPESHGLIYGSCFYKDIVENNTELTIIETDGTSEANDIAIDTYDPILITGIGHGACCLYSVENKEKYIQLGETDCRIFFEGRYYEYHCDEDLRLDKFQDRIIHLLSCVTADKLGPALIEHGAKAYVGYDNLFIYGVKSSEGDTPEPCSPPVEFADFFTFNNSDVEIDRSLLKGNNFGEAVIDSKNKFLDYIKKYTEGEWKNRGISSYASRFLIHDLNHQISLGDESATVTTKELPPMESNMLLPIIFLLIGGILVHQLLVLPTTTMKNQLP